MASSIDESIAKVVELFRRFSDLRDNDILATLQREGVDGDLAERLITFIPMVYVRILLKESPIQFSEDYEIEGSEGDRHTRHLSDEPCWFPIFAHARIENGKRDQLKRIVECCRTKR